MDKVLHAIWYHPKTGFTSGKVLYTRAKQEQPSITRAQVEEWLAKQRTAQLHKPARKAKSVGFILAEYVNQRWQADLVDMSSYPGTLKRKKMLWILIVVDVFSRKLYARALQTKEAIPVAAAFIDITEEAGAFPVQLDTDQGGEFGKTFDSKIGETRHGRAKIGDHRALGVVDSTIRIFKGLIFRATTTGTDWAAELMDLVENFNSMDRGALYGHSPNDVETNVNLRAELGTMDQYKRGKMAATVEEKPPYAVGDKVRVPAQTGPFKRGFKQQMTEKKYPVSKVNAKSVEVNVDGQIRRYLFSEIAQTGVPLDKDVFEVEKILDQTRTITRGRTKNIKQQLVLFKGDKEPTWTDVADIMK